LSFLARKITPKINKQTIQTKRIAPTMIPAITPPERPESFIAELLSKAGGETVVWGVGVGWVGVGEGVG